MNWNFRLDQRAVLDCDEFPLAAGELIALLGAGALHCLL